jgi:A/G-specific adenine glycosylase
MLGGMLAFPSAGWTKDDDPYAPDRPFASAPFAADWRIAGESVSHVFTHFSLRMDVAVADCDETAASGGWHAVRPASLPTLMRKVWAVARRRA